jgi:hypothetical protein
MKTDLLPIFGLCFAVGCFVGVISYKSNPDNIIAAYREINDNSEHNAGVKDMAEICAYVTERPKRYVNGKDNKNDE